MLADQMILGQGCIYSTDPEETGLNNNVLICGSSGSGKTMSISEPLFLKTYHRSLIALVTKRRVVDKYTPLFQHRGYQVMELNFTDPSKGDVGYDPLQYITSYQDITFLAQAIVMSNTRKERSNADPYWDTAAISLLSAEIAYILMDKGEDATFTDVLDLHGRLQVTSEYDSLMSTSLDPLFAQLEEQDPGCFAVTCWKSFSTLPIRTGGCVFSTLNTTLDSIFTEEIRRLMRLPQKVDLEEIASRKSVLFITSSPVNPALHSFVNMFYGQMFKQLFEFGERQINGHLPVPVHVLCDDFATGSPIVNFAQYISIFREKGLSCTLLLQSESQLQAMYGDRDATTIINGCDSYVFLGGMDILTAKNISVRLDAPLNEVLSLPVGREIVFRRGEKPIITDRYHILDDDIYRGVSRQYEDRIQHQRRARRQEI